MGNPAEKTTGHPTIGDLGKIVSIGKSFLRAPTGAMHIWFD
jgi:hypothetical protein